MIAQTILMKDVLAGAERIAPPPKDGVVLINGADLKPEPVRWLWHEWLALGKIALLAGSPGQGKTTVSMAFVATVTSGGHWPDGSRCEPGNVLIWSGEDDVADTLLPRTLASGGDRTRCFFITGTRRDGEIRSFDPARDIAELQAEAERIGGVKLIVVDPIVTAVTGDSHKNTEVRRDLQPLVDLATRLDAALIGITHLSKGGIGGDPVTRVLGSIAFVAVARVVLVAAKVKGEDGEDRRILARGKSNIGPDGGGFTYSIAQCEPLPGIQASRIEWGQPVEGTARELLAEPRKDSADEGDTANALETALQFLRTVLAEGITPSKSVQSQAREAGVALRTLRRASEALCVIKTKGADCWYWSLPVVMKPRGPVTDEEVVHVGQPVQALKDGQVGQLGRVDGSNSQI